MSAEAPAVSTARTTHVALLVGVCVALSLALTADRIIEVWQTGAFFDTDDATRAVQLRAWMGGQPWYDLTIGRMNPPGGVFMHWSRVVDLPLAALVALAAPFTSADGAERFARIVFPLGCFVALLIATGTAAAAFGGARARLAGVALCFLGAPFLGQFVPGRIDHHAPQIVLLIIAVGAALRSFDPGAARHAALAGFAAAASLSISLENLPFIAILSASYPLLFVWLGNGASRAMMWFAATFAGSLVCLVVATVGPSHWSDASCDALSLAHLTPVIAGCAVLLALAGSAAALQTPLRRAAAVVALAPVPFIVVGLVAPKCLGDPFVGLDPLVREIWL